MRNRVLNETQIKALILARFTLDEGKQILRSGKTPFHWGLSVIHFHNAVEFALGAFRKSLPSEMAAKLSKPDWTFPEYLKVDNRLDMRDQMHKLNSIRVNVKHLGIMPLYETAKELEILTLEFLRDNVRDILCLEFESVSLADLVNDDEIRDLIKSATAALDQKNIEVCAEALAKAYYLIPSKARDDLSYRLRDIERLPELGPWEQSRESRHWHEALARIVNEMASRIHLVELGIKVKNLDRFYSFIPAVGRTDAGICYCYSKRDYDPKDSNTIEEAEFCVNFLIDLALKAG